jgi:hypothetical protein
MNVTILKDWFLRGADLFSVVALQASTENGAKSEEQRAKSREQRAKRRERRADGPAANNSF